MAGDGPRLVHSDSLLVWVPARRRALWGQILPPGLHLLLVKCRGDRRREWGAGGGGADGHRHAAVRTKPAALLGPEVVFLDSSCLWICKVKGSDPKTAGALTRLEQQLMLFKTWV